MNEDFISVYQALSDNGITTVKAEDAWSRAQKDPEYASRVYNKVVEMGLYNGDMESLWGQKKKDGQSASQQPAQPSGASSTPVDRSGKRPAVDVGQGIYAQQRAQEPSAPFGAVVPPKEEKPKLTFTNVNDPAQRAVRDALTSSVNPTGVITEDLKANIGKEVKTREEALRFVGNDLQAKIEEIGRLREGLAAMEDGRIAATPEERNAAIERYNANLESVKADQVRYEALYDGYKRSVAKAAMLDRKEQKTKEATGSPFGGLYNKWLLQDLPAMAGGYTEFFTKYGPYAVQSGAFVIPGMAEAAGKEANQATKDFLANVADPNTTEEYINNMVENGSFGAKATYAILNPALLTAMVDGGAGFGAQSYYGAKREMEEIAKALPVEDRASFERDAEGIALASAGVEMVLEKVGLDEMISPTLRKLVMARAVRRMGEMGTRVGARQFNEIVEAEARTVLGEVGSKALNVGGAALGEGVTEGLNSIAQDEMRLAYNAVKGKDIFDPKTQRQIILDGIYSAALGAAGGGGMNLLINVAGKSNPTAQDYEGALAFLSDIPSMDYVGQALAADVKSGKMDKERADAIFETIGDYKSALDAIPEDLQGKERVKAVDLIRERRGLEQKMAKADPAFKPAFEEKIAKVNAEILSLSLSGKPKEGGAPVAEPTEQVLKDQEAVMAARPEAVAQAAEEAAIAADTQEQAERVAESAERPMGMSVLTPDAPSDVPSVTPSTVPSEEVAQVEAQPDVATDEKGLSNILSRVFGLKKKQSNAAAKVATKVFDTIAARTGRTREQAMSDVKWREASVDAVREIADDPEALMQEKSLDVDVYDLSKQVNKIDVESVAEADAVNIGLPLFQEGDAKAQAAVRLMADGSAIVYALNDPNVSSPLHELAHVYEQYLTADEAAAIERWSKHKRGTREFSEAFARGFERYLAEGKAPVPGLQKIFDDFKKWLTEIYNGIKGSPIDLQLTPAAVKVFDAMFEGKAATSKVSPTGNRSVKDRVLYQSAPSASNIRKALSAAIAKVADIKEHQRIAMDIAKRVLFGDNVKPKDLNRIAAAALKISEKPISLYNFALAVKAIKDRSERGAQISEQRTNKKKLNSVLDSRSTPAELKSLAADLLNSYEEDAATNEAWNKAAKAILDLRAPSKPIPDRTDLDAIRADVQAAQAAATANRQATLDEYAAEMQAAYGMSATDAMEAAEFIVNGTLPKKVAERAIELENGAGGVRMTRDDAVEAATNEWKDAKADRLEQMLDNAQSTIDAVEAIKDEVPEAWEALEGLDIRRLSFQDLIAAVRFARGVLSGDIEGGIDYVRMLRDAQRKVDAPKTKPSSTVRERFLAISGWWQSLLYHMGRDKDAALTNMTNLGFDDTYQMRNKGNNKADTLDREWSKFELRDRLINNEEFAVQSVAYSLLNAYESYDPKKTGAPDQYFKAVIRRMRRDADAMEKSGMGSLMRQVPIVRQVADQMEVAGSKDAFYDSLPESHKRGIELFVDAHASAKDDIRNYFVRFLNKPFKEAPRYLAIGTVSLGAVSTGTSVSDQDLDAYFNKAFRSTMSVRSDNLLERDTPINQWMDDDGRVINYDFASVQKDAYRNNLIEAYVTPTISQYLHIKKDPKVVDSMGSTVIKLYDLIIKELLGVSGVAQSKLAGLTDAEAARKYAMEAAASHTAAYFFSSIIKAASQFPVFISTIGQVGPLQSMKALPTSTFLSDKMGDIESLSTIAGRNLPALMSKTFGVRDAALRGVPVVGPLSDAIKEGDARFRRAVVNFPLLPERFRDKAAATRTGEWRMAALKGADRITALTAWRMAYVAYWQGKGEVVDDAFIAKKNADARAGKSDPGVTYADTMLQRDQGANSLEDRARAFTKWAQIFRVLMPFSSFSINKAVTNWGNVAKLGRGGKASAEAATELAFSLADAFVYAAVRYYAIPYAYAAVRTLLDAGLDLVGLDDEDEEDEMKFSDYLADAKYKRSQALSSIISTFTAVPFITESVSIGINAVMWKAYNASKDPTDQLTYEDFYTLGMAPFYTRVKPKTTFESIAEQFVSWLGSPLAMSDAIAKINDANRGYYKDAYGNVVVIPKNMRDDYLVSAEIYFLAALTAWPALTDLGEGAKMDMRKIRSNTLDVFEAIRAYQYGEIPNERVTPQNILSRLPKSVVEKAAQKYGDQYIVKLMEQYEAGAKRVEDMVRSEDFRGAGTYEGSIRAANPELFERMAKPVRDIDVRKTNPKVRGMYVASLIKEEIKRMDDGKSTPQDVIDLLTWIDNQTRVLHQSTYNQEIKEASEALGEEYRKRIQEITLAD